MLMLEEGDGKYQHLFSINIDLKLQLLYNLAKTVSLYLAQIFLSLERPKLQILGWPRGHTTKRFSPFMDIWNFIQ